MIDRCTRSNRAGTSPSSTLATKDGTWSSRTRGWQDGLSHDTAVNTLIRVSNTESWRHLIFLEWVRIILILPLTNTYFGKRCSPSLKQNAVHMNGREFRHVRKLRIFRRSYSVSARWRHSGTGIGRRRVASLSPRAALPRRKNTEYKAGCNPETVKTFRRRQRCLEPTRSRNPDPPFHRLDTVLN